MDFPLTADPIARLLRYRGVGETLCIAETVRGHPAALFIDRWHETQSNLAFGMTAEAVVDEILPGKSGAFLTVKHGSGLPAFLALKPGSTIVRGARIDIRIASEAYGDKLARAVQCPPVPKHSDPVPISPFDAWRDSLKVPQEIEVVDTEDTTPFDHAIDLAALDRVSTSNGAVIRIGLTDALTAIDVDTSRLTLDRPGKDRARIVNLEAISTVARELSFRSLGGLIVLDCVGPIAKDDLKPLRDAMYAGWRMYRSGPAQILQPSPLGLMEMSLSRTTAPLIHRLFEVGGTDLTAEAYALKAFRAAERAARHDRAASIDITLPEAAFAWHKQHEKQHMEAFQARFGARITIRPEKV